MTYPVNTDTRSGWTRAGWRQGVLASVIMGLPLIAFMSVPAAIPVLLRHFGNEPHATLLVPMLASASSAGIALFSPIAGGLADRFGRRRVALISTILYALCGLVPLFTDNLKLVFLGRVALGFANAGLTTLGAALLGDYFDGDARRRWLGLAGMIGSILVTIALFTGGLLADWNWRGPLLTPLIGAIIAAFSWRWLFEPQSQAESRDSAGSTEQPFSWIILAHLVFLTFAASIWFYVESVQIGLVLDQDGVGPQSKIALVCALISIGYPVGAIIYGQIGHRLSSRAMSAAAWLMTGAGLIGVGHLRDVASIGLSGFIQQLGGGILVTLLMHSGQECFAFRFRARVMGVWTSAFFAGQFVSPLIMGSVSSLASGLRPAIVLMGVAAILASAFIALGYGVLRASKPTTTMSPG